MTTIFRIRPSGNDKYIRLPYPVDYDDIKKICNTLGVPNSIARDNHGNYTIDLPMDFFWDRIMRDEPCYNRRQDVIYHYKRRLLFFNHENFYGADKFTFCTSDWTINSETVLTWTDIINIVDVVHKIHLEKLNPTN